MNRRTMTLVAVVVLFVAALCFWLAPRTVSAQNAGALSAPVYNPYPPGILPANLNSELARVLAEWGTIPVCAVPPCTPVQPRTGSFLWWKLLGFTRDRISVKESRRPSGTGSSRRYSRNGQSGYCLHRLQALQGSVPAAL